MYSVRYLCLISNKFGRIFIEIVYIQFHGRTEMIIGSFSDYANAHKKTANCLATVNVSKRIVFPSVNCDRDDVGWF
jgi:hypothetical protein